MLDAKTIATAVDLQRRSYRLLRWLSDAITRGFITFKTAHQFATRLDATIAWLDEH